MSYAKPFDASEALSPAQERSLLAALGLGVLLTVLLLAWAAVAARISPSSASSSASESASVIHKGDNSPVLRVEAGGAEWLTEDASF